jgi:MFS family permease
MSKATATVAEHVQAKTSVRWKIFLTLLLLVTVNYIDRASLSVAMPMIASEFTLTPVMQGFIMSSFFWSYTLMQIPGGVAVDRFKPRLVLALCTLLWGAFQGLGALTTNAAALLFTRLGLGVAEAPVASAGGALNAIWLTQHERVRGASLMDGGSPLGAALGSLLIAWLIVVAHSWRAAFAIAGVGTILCGIGTWFYIRNHSQDHAGVNAAEAEHIEQARQQEYENDSTDAPHVVETAIGHTDLHWVASPQLVPNLNATPHTLAPVPIITVSQPSSNHSLVMKMVPQRGLYAGKHQLMQLPVYDVASRGGRTCGGGAVSRDHAHRHPRRVDSCA